MKHNCSVLAKCRIDYRYNRRRIFTTVGYLYSRTVVHTMYFDFKGSLFCPQSLYPCTEGAMFSVR